MTFGHPSQDTTKRYPTDAFLRRMGYSIYQRPKTGPAMWRSPSGRVMTEPQAVNEASEKMEKLESQR